MKQCNGYKCIHAGEPRTVEYTPFSPIPSECTAHDQASDNHELHLKIAAENMKATDLETNRMRGPGGAPTRATTLPNEPAERKNFPIASGVLDYFPDALVAIAEISKAGNDQHNPGLPLRWTRGKSGDEADTCIRHFLQRGTRDTDGKRHTAKAAWRMLALLQKEIEQDQDGGNK